MSKLNDLSRSLVPLNPDTTLIAVIEISQSSWLVAGIVPGIERQPLKKLDVDKDALLKLLHRWRDEAVRRDAISHASRLPTKLAVTAFGWRVGFRAQDIEAHVIHASSVAVSREHRRAKTDRLDTELLKRSFLGWLRGERDHCNVVAIPTLEQEDAERPNRERDEPRRRAQPHRQPDEIRVRAAGHPRLQSEAEECGGSLAYLSVPQRASRFRPRRALQPSQARYGSRRQLDTPSDPADRANAPWKACDLTPKTGPQLPRYAWLASVVGLGAGTADMLVHEAFLARNMRDRRAGGLAIRDSTPAPPDESGAKRRAKGLFPLRQCSRAAGHGRASLALPPASRKTAPWRRRFPNPHRARP